MKLKWSKMEQHKVNLEINMQETSDLRIGQFYDYIVAKAKRMLEYRLGTPYVETRNWEVVRYKSIEKPNMHLLVEIIFQG